MSDVQKSADSVQEMYSNLTESIVKVLEHPSTPPFVSETLSNALDEIANHYDLDDEPRAARARRVMPRLVGQIEQNENLKA